MYLIFLNLNESIFKIDFSLDLRSIPADAQAIAIPTIFLVPHSRAASNSFINTLPAEYILISFLLSFFIYTIKKESR